MWLAWNLDTTNELSQVNLDWQELVKNFKNIIKIIKMGWNSSQGTINDL